MKYSLLIFALVFALGCKKDNDTTDNPTPTPSAKTCRIKSATKAGKKLFEITYDSLGRISKWMEYDGFNTIPKTFTFQYQSGGNKVFIGGVNSYPFESD
jgi:hypothetical protein